MKISQREARRLRKRVHELEYQERKRGNAWCYEWPMGVNIGRVKLNGDSALVGAIRTSRLLKHAVVVSCDETGIVNFHAMPL